MKGIYMLTILLLCGICSFAQEKKYYSEENIIKAEREFPEFLPWYSVYDSLLVKNKVLYFKNSPIDYLDDSESILFDDVVVLPKIDQGYRLLWKVKNNKLYIKEITTTRRYETVLTRDEQREKIEQFLDRKFEKEGIFADFVTGKFILYKYALSLKGRNIENKNEKYISYNTNFDRVNSQYKRDIMGKQAIYIAEFKNGILVKLSRDKEREKEYKRKEDKLLEINDPIL